MLNGLEYNVDKKLPAQSVARFAGMGINQILRSCDTVKKIAENLPTVNQSNIPYGYCHCNCGELAPIANETRPARGIYRNEPYRFIKGHDKRRPFNDCEIVGSVLRIFLPGGEIALCDLVDFDLVSQYRWSGAGPRKGPHKRRIVRMRRLQSNGVFGLSMQVLLLGTRDGYEIDHKNRNSMDNRRENLRWATRMQNCHNTGSKNKWGFKGVKSDKGKWIARITANKQKIHLGTFPTPKDAAIAYNEAAIKYHGEFAYLNVFNDEG